MKQMLWGEFLAGCRKNKYLFIRTRLELAVKQAFR
jgi:hypothetical protein